MAYVLPVFNMTCDIYTSGDHTVAPRVVAAPCNLAWGRRVATAIEGTFTAGIIPDFCLTLMLPAGTDIRGARSTTSGDAVEVPSGSGRYYLVAVADNIGMGFTNEHKAALIFQEDSFKTPDT